MNRRVDFVLLAAVGSVVMLAGLGYWLFRESHTPGPRPLVVYCAAALKPAATATADEYERETGVRIEFRFGNSEHVLSTAALVNDGDLFLPADDSYVRIAEQKGLIASTTPLARMRLVVLTRPGNPRGIATFEDLLAKDLRFGQANPDAAAVARVTRDELRRLGKWDALAAKTLVLHATVTDAANAVAAGSNDAAVVWDAVAANYPDLAVVRLPELNGAVGRGEVAVLKSAADADEARRFVRYLAATDRGQRHFRAAGFTDLEPGGPWE